MVFFGGLLCLVFSHSKDLSDFSLGDLVMKGKIHKANSGCGYSGIQALIKKKFGYLVRCGCGFEFRQKRLVSQSILKVQTLSKDDENVFCRCFPFVL